MCKKCQRLLELWAETSLECLKRNKTINVIIIKKCSCGEDIPIAISIGENKILLTKERLI